MRNEILSLLVLLIAATGAWAQTQITQDFENGLGDWTMAKCHSNSGITEYYTPTHGGTNMFCFYYTTNIPQYLISPKIDAAGGGTMSFYYARYNSNYSETFKVGYSTTTNDPTAFTWGDEVTCINTYNINRYWEYTYDIPARAKYVAIACTSNDRFNFFVDDITIVVFNAAEVTTNAASEGTTFTEASFAMPTFDATATYELVRDMAKSVTATMNASLFRIMEDGQGGYKPVEGMPTPELTVKDELGTEAVTMTEGTTAAPADYTAVLQKLTSEEGAQEEEWTDVSAEDGPTLGTFRYAITGQGDYDGTIYSPTFQMSLRIPSEISFAQTSLNKDKGDVFVNTLTNTGDGEVTYKLTGDNIATIDPETGKVTITGQPGVVTVTATVEDSGDYSYETKSVTYVISVGLPLANPPYDYDDQSIGAHKLALLTVINIAKEIDLTNKTDKSANKLRMTIAECEELLTSKTVTHEELDEARIRLLIAIDNLEDKAPADADADIANGQNQENEETTGVRPIDNGQLTIENWYTLNGRKLDKKPTKKGVYILNGRKVVIK